jgi:hypothetical protein
MPAKIVNQGLQREAINTSAVGTTPGSALTTSRWVQTMAVDDGTVAFAATDLALNTGGAIANSFDKLLDSSPTRTAQTVTHTMTIPDVSGNFTIRRISLHDDTASNVTSSSSTLFGGSDGLSVLKTSDFNLGLTLKLVYSDNS